MRFEVLGLFGHDKISMIFAGGILILGLGAAILLWASTTLRTRQIQRAISAVESAEDRQDFARKFDTISTRIEALRLLQAHWLDFKSTLLFSYNPETGQTIVQCTANVSDQFSASRSNEGWRDERILPGIFLSLALLLTVVGAAASMTTALNAIDHRRISLDPKNANTQLTQTKQSARPTAQAVRETSRVAPPQAALHQFLSAGKASFTLAVAGLFISLLLKIVLRTCTSRLRSALQKFSTAIQQRVVRVSFEAAVLSKLAAISTATAGQDAATNVAIGENLRLTIEQSLPHHLEHVTAKLHAAIDHHSARSDKAAQTSSDNLAEELDRLITDRVFGPLRNTNEQMQEQFLSLRENLLNLSNNITNNRNSDPPGKSASLDLETTERTEVELSSFIEATERVQKKLISSNRADIDEMANGLKSKIEQDVIDPLRTMNTVIIDLKSSLAAVQDSIGSAVPTSTSDDTASYDELSAKLQELQTSIEHNGVEQATLSGQLITEIVERLEVCIASPIEDITNTLKEVQANYQAVDLAAAEPHMPNVDGNVDWHEAIQDIQSRLVGLDATVSAVSSLAGKQNEAGRTDDENNELLEQNETTINYLADRFDSHIVSPLQELTTSTAEIQQALSDNELRTAEAMSTTSDAILQSIRIAADGLRIEIKDLMDRGDGENACSIFPDQIRQYCEDLDRVAQQLVHNSSAIETQLSHLIETLPSDASSKAEDTLITTNAGTDSTVPVAELDVSSAGKKQMLSSTQQRALEILDQMATDSDLATFGVQIAADDVHTAISALTRQANVEWELARLTLIEQIDRCDGMLEEMTRHWDQNASTITTQFKQLIESAPVNWSREAAEVAESAERTVRLVVHDTRRSLKATSSGRTTASALDEMMQTTAALAQISGHLVRQTAETREVIASQLTSTMNVIERASTNIFATVSGLGDGLTQDARAVANDALVMLVKASTELESVTRKSSEATIPTLMGILQDARRARELIASDLEHTSSANSLHETLLEIANSMANLSRNLSTTTDSLVLTLQTLSNEVRLREGQFAMENSSPMEADVTAFRTSGQSGPLVSQ